MLQAKRRRVVSVKPSRNACRTCRIRKVKCDETKPGCRRCSSTGRKCDGYPITASKPLPEAITAQRKLLPASGLYAHPVSTSVPAVVAMDIPVSDHEKLAYEWFIRESASVLWHTSPAKKWIRLALQLATHEETVFYAATAVASIHRAQPNTYHHSLSQPVSPEKCSGLNQYCKATTSLQRYINGAISNGFQLEPVVLCCLLFVVFEVFQQNGHQALSHLRWLKALALGADANTPTQRKQLLPHSTETRNELLVMFKELEAEIDVAPRTLHFPTDPRTPCTLSRIITQTSFVSAEMAKECLCNITEASAQFREDLVKRASSGITPADKILRKAVKYCIAHCLGRKIDWRHDKQLWNREKELRQAHEDWLRLFTEMNVRSTAITSATLTLMEIQHILSKRTLHACLVTREDQLDQCETEDSRALDLVERYLTHSTNLHIVSPPLIEETFIPPELQRSFSLDDGILPILYLICLKCRSSKIRHRAWRILRDADRREGLQYSRALADRARDIIQLEEHRAKDILGVVSLDDCRIPEAARLSDVVVESISPFESRVICGRFQHENQGELEVLEYQRLRGPFIHPDPIWQVILKNRDRDGSRWIAVQAHGRNSC